jgi:hypothetical protein
MLDVFSSGSVTVLSLTSKAAQKYHVVTFQDLPLDKVEFMTFPESISAWVIK